MFLTTTTKILRPLRNLSLIKLSNARHNTKEAQIEKNTLLGKC